MNLSLPNSYLPFYEVFEYFLPIIYLILFVFFLVLIISKIVFSYKNNSFEKNKFSQLFFYAFILIVLIFMIGLVAPRTMEAGLGVYIYSIGAFLLLMVTFVVVHILYFILYLFRNHRLKNRN
jgi:tellurite resistance protein TehA-like permease